MAPDQGHSFGVPQDLSGVPGRRTTDAAHMVVPSRVPVRVRGFGDTGFPLNGDSESLFGGGGAVAVVRIFRMGIDFGFYHDPTALVVVEPRLDPERVDANGYPLVRFEVRFTERVPLGTTAQGIVSRITEIVDKLEARALRPQIEVFVDATGTGVAVKDLLAPELQRQGTHLSVSYTHLTLPTTERV